MAAVRKSEDALLTALACGLSVEQAARQTGVSTRTIQRRLAEANFRFRLDELRHEMLARSCAMLTAAGVESVRTLVELLKPQQAATTRLQAARAILDLGVKLRQLVDVEERVHDLERRYAELSAELSEREAAIAAMRASSIRELEQAVAAAKLPRLILPGG